MPLIARRRIDATPLKEPPEKSDWRITKDALLDYVRGGLVDLQMPEHNRAGWYVGDRVENAAGFARSIEEAARDQVMTNEQAREFFERRRSRDRSQTSEVETAEVEVRLTEAVRGVLEGGNQKFANAGKQYLVRNQAMCHPKNL